MARAGRQDGHVASLQREDPPLFAAKSYAALAARDAEHLMDLGVVMHIIVDAVAPGIFPSVRLEQVFDHGRGVLAVIESDSFSADDQRPARMIWDETVVLEADPVGLSRSHEVHGPQLAGPPQASCALRIPLQVFKGRHDRPSKCRPGNRSKAGELENRPQCEARHDIARPVRQHHDARERQSNRKRSDCQTGAGRQCACRRCQGSHVQRMARGKGILTFAGKRDAVDVPDDRTATRPALVEHKLQTMGLATLRP
jgi:hypothetical protein